MVNNVSYSGSDSKDVYGENSLIRRDRRLADDTSSWVRSFGCEHLRPLIICRGPIRKEAMDTFTDMGISDYGILLSEKDSITYPNALSPELRSMTRPDAIHRVPDYTGASKEERGQRIRQIINIAHDNGYNAIFAGYGFMAEDEEMVAAMEKAGLNFIGPCSRTVHSAGLKDEAKRTALKVGVSVTPGIDNASALTLLNKYGSVKALVTLAKEKDLAIDFDLLQDDGISLEEKADLVLAGSYDAGIDLFTIEELQAQIEKSVAKMYGDYPENRIRLKAIGGGGGKGQRILAAPTAYKGSAKERVAEAASKAPELVLEVLNEVKTTGVGDNKNVLVELNIETTRHQEIQVIGNGEWSMTMGARDCSLQMYEQKLLEVSSTQESIADSIATAKRDLKSGVGSKEALATLEQDLKTLVAMEEEAARFGEAVGLDSVSTFECIVDRGSHFFMEMNTRIQVEHRVSELCYDLVFTGPDGDQDKFVVDSLVELMVLLACHGSRLPKPERRVRKASSVEARLNATNEALQPHAGGLIEWWSQPLKDEIRDDQGISKHNPDTSAFVKYKLAGAYDSNIALILTYGDDRLDSYERLAEIVRKTRLSGSDLCTNLEFHCGLVNWFIGNHIEARPTTRFIVPYITAVALLKQAANGIDLAYAYSQIVTNELTSLGLDGDSNCVAEYKKAVERKRSLVLRPIEVLFSKPHVLAGWLSVHRVDFNFSSGVALNVNPLQLLDDLYHYLDMGYSEKRPAQDIIWDHDAKILAEGIGFYRELEARFDTLEYSDLELLLGAASPPAGSDIDAEFWASIQASHRGFQAGLDILKVVPYLALSTEFFDLKVNPDLSIHIPERLEDQALQAKAQKILVPPPVAKGDEILAASGGMFYPREAPGMDSYVNEGDHFEAGDVLYIVEVMKMFNKVTAEFSGTVEKVYIDGDGVIISKGQPLFKIIPDEKFVHETDADAKKRISAATQQLIDKLA